MTRAPLQHQRLREATPCRRRDASASVGRILAGLSAVALGTLNACVMLFAASLRCDESCSDTPASWHENADAWQWPALGWLGATAFALSVAFAITFAGRWPRASATLLAGALAAGLIPWLALGVA